MLLNSWNELICCIKRGTTNLRLLLRLLLEKHVYWTSSGGWSSSSPGNGSQRANEEASWQLRYRRAPHHFFSFISFHSGMHFILAEVRPLWVSGTWLRSQLMPPTEWAGGGRHPGTSIFQGLSSLAHGAHKLLRTGGVGGWWRDGTGRRRLETDRWNRSGATRASKW